MLDLVLRALELSGLRLPLSTKIQSFVQSIMYRDQELASRFGNLIEISMTLPPFWLTNKAVYDGSHFFVLTDTPRGVTISIVERAMTSKFGGSIDFCDAEIGRLYGGFANGGDHDDRLGYIELSNSGARLILLSTNGTQVAECNVSVAKSSIASRIVSTLRKQTIRVWRQVTRAHPGRTRVPSASVFSKVTNVIAEQ